MAMPAFKKDQLKSGAEVQGKLAKAAVPSPEKAPVFAGAREVDELHSFFGNKFHISRHVQVCPSICAVQRKK